MITGILLELKRRYNIKWVADRKLVHMPYTSAFYNLDYRYIILEEQQQICLICGTKIEDYDGVFQLHHIDYDKQNDKRENLVFLCNSCHTKTGYDREKWMGFFNDKQTA
jgi:5-methylcytosine-specific restriction endonuclease McrA